MWVHFLANDVINWPKIEFFQKWSKCQNIDFSTPEKIGNPNLSHECFIIYCYAEHSL